MSDFLGRIAARAVGEAPVARPRSHSLFEDDGLAAPGALEVADEEVLAVAPPRVADHAGHEGFRTTNQLPSPLPLAVSPRAALVEPGRSTRPGLRSPEPAAPGAAGGFDENVKSARPNPCLPCRVTSIPANRNSRPRRSRLWCPRLRSSQRRRVLPGPRRRRRPGRMPSRRPCACTSAGSRFARISSTRRCRGARPATRSGRRSCPSPTTSEASGLLHEQSARDRGRQRGAAQPARQRAGRQSARHSGRSRSPRSRRTRSSSTTPTRRRRSTSSSTVRAATRAGPRSGCRRTTANGTRLSNPPLALDLHYLLTAYGTADFQAEILLGYAMHLLHERPGARPRRDPHGARPEPARPDDPAAGVPGAHRLRPRRPARGGDDHAESMDTEEMSRLWSAIQAHYRPTAAYLVSVVLIEARKPTRQPLPVLSRGPRRSDHGTDRGVVVEPSCCRRTRRSRASIRRRTSLQPVWARRFGSPAITSTARAAVARFAHRLLDEPTRSRSARAPIRPGHRRRRFPRAATAEQDWPAGVYTVTASPDPAGRGRRRATSNVAAMLLAPEPELPPTTIDRATRDPARHRHARRSGRRCGRRRRRRLDARRRQPRSPTRTRRDGDARPFELGAVPPGAQWVAAHGRRRREPAGRPLGRAAALRPDAVAWRCRHDRPRSAPAAGARASPLVARGRARAAACSRRCRRRRAAAALGRCARRPRVEPAADRARRRLLGLSRSSATLLLLAAAVELDGDVAALVRGAPATATTRARPSASRSRRFPDAALGRARARLAAAPLAAGRARQPGRRSPRARCRLDERVLHHLTGRRPLDERLDGRRAIARRTAPLGPSQRGVAEELAAHARCAAGRRVRRAARRRATPRPPRLGVARRRSAQARPGRRSLVARRALPPAGSELARAARLIDREALLLDGLPVVDAEGGAGRSRPAARGARARSSARRSESRGAPLARTRARHRTVPRPDPAEQREPLAPRSASRRRALAEAVEEVVRSTSRLGADGDRAAAGRRRDGPAATVARWTSAAGRAACRRGPALDGLARADRAAPPPGTTSSCPTAQLERPARVVAHVRHRTPVYERVGLRRPRLGAGSA